jgi:hypothetical protein
MSKSEKDINKQPDAVDITMSVMPVCAALQLLFSIFI